MSVLARFRSQSKLQVYTDAVTLRKKIIILLLKDLGIKDKVRKTILLTKGMEEKDAEQFLDIATKYGLANFVEEYPEWIIEKFRQNLWDLSAQLVYHITNAYTVWSTNKVEAEERRMEMNRAIACCEKLLKEFEMIAEIIPVDVKKFMPYVEDIEKEIALLKAWRKSDNKRLREFE